MSWDKRLIDLASAAGAGYISTQYIARQLGFNFEEDMRELLQTNASVGDTDDDTNQNSGYITISPGLGIGSGGGGVGTLTGTLTGNTSFTYNSNARATFGSAPSVQKSDVRHVIVKEDDSTLELREQATITPREMIGISKLLALTAVFTGGAAMYNTTISWSSLIVELGIDGHFVKGLPVDDYPEDDEVLNIFLYDNS